MTRTEAIELLVQRELAALGPEERQSLLLDWWSIDADDPEYEELPQLLKAALRVRDVPDDPKSLIYDPLLLVALRHAYVGVVNSYLETRLRALGRTDEVEGIVERLEECPCCGYRSLDERGTYDICRVCFWEDDGSAGDTHSGPNHMTLNEARQKVAEIGAVHEGSLRAVLPDRRERYARGDQ
jgi:hypothetical protein